MYKKAMRSQMRCSRTGSHSTMPRATGLVELMPQWAKPPEEYYNTLRDQYQQLLEYMHDVEAKIKPITDKLKRPLPYDEFQQTKAVHSEYGRVLQIVQRQMEAFAPIVRAAQIASLDAICFHLARNHLNPDIVDEIRKEAEGLVKEWRVLPPLKKRRFEMSDEQLSIFREKEQRHKKRSRNRNIRQFKPASYFAKSANAALRKDMQQRDREYEHRLREAAKSAKTADALLCDQQTILREKMEQLRKHFAKEESAS